MYVCMQFVLINKELTNCVYRTGEPPVAYYAANIYTFVNISF